jgi:hypothetical protein
MLPFLAALNIYQTEQHETRKKIKTSNIIRKTPRRPIGWKPMLDAGKEDNKSSISLLSPKYRTTAM